MKNFSFSKDRTDNREDIHYVINRVKHEVCEFGDGVTEFTTKDIGRLIEELEYLRDFPTSQSRRGEELTMEQIIDRIEDDKILADSGGVGETINNL